MLTQSVNKARETGLMLPCKGVHVALYDIVIYTCYLDRENISY